MNFHIALRLLAVLVVIGSGAVSVEATVYDLYYLGGQSNMDGYGRVEELPEGLSGAVDNVMIFHGNTSGDTTAEAGRGVWAQLRPGHGVGYGSDGKTATYSDRFGIEITFARTLQELDPDASFEEHWASAGREYDRQNKPKG